MDRHSLESLLRRSSVLFKKDSSSRADPPQAKKIFPCRLLFLSRLLRIIGMGDALVGAPDTYVHDVRPPDSGEVPYVMVPFFFFFEHVRDGAWSSSTVPCIWILDSWSTDYVYTSHGKYQSFIRQLQLATCDIFHMLNPALIKYTRRSAAGKWQESITFFILTSSSPLAS